MPSLKLILAPLAIALPLCAQDPPAQEPLAAIAAAEKAIAASDPETALLLLWRAAEEVRTAPPSALRQSTATAIAQLLQRVDPANAERRTVGTGVSRRLAGLARAYRERKWKATARSVALLAASFDEGPAAPELTALGGEAGRLAAPTDPMEALGCSFQDGGWRIESGTLWSPSPLTASVSAVYMTKAEHEDHRIAVDVDIGKQGAMVGILVGGKGDDDYFICDHIYNAKTVGLTSTLYRWSGGTVHPIGEGECQLDRKRSGPMRFEVFVRGAQIECRVDGVKAFDVDCGEPVRGTVGFYVSGASAYRGSLAFRNFVIDYLPENAPSAAARAAAAQEQLQKTAEEALADAGALLRDGRPEVAAARARESRATALRLEPGPQRSSIVAAIDALLQKADPLLPRRVEVLARAAESLRPLAERYAAAGLPRAAAAVAERMVQLDPDGQAATAADFAQRAAIARSQREAERQRAQVELSIDNTALREWFGDGARPFEGADQTWKFGFDGALSPAVTNGEAWILAGRGEGAAQASVQFQLPATATVGLVFAWQSEAEFAVAQVRWLADGLRLELRQRHGGKWVELGGTTCKVDAAARDGWIELGLECKEQLTVRCAGETLAVPAPMVPIRGRLGLMVRGRGASVAVPFRAFRPPVSPAVPAAADK